MGATHFLTKGLERVKTEMSLHVLAYNFRRLLVLLGMASMMSVALVAAGVPITPGNITMQAGESVERRLESGQARLSKVLLRL